MLLKNVILLEYYCYEMKLVQDTKYLASHFCYFSGIMLHKNFEYLLIFKCKTVNSDSDLFDGNTDKNKKLFIFCFY